MLTSTVTISLLDSAPIAALGWQRLPEPARSVDADAVARAQAGDPDAFSDLYFRHKMRVFSICIRMVRDPQLAEDLTQETFLQVHRKLGTFRGDSVFTTWLHRLAVNIVLMHLRKRVLPVVSLDDLMTDDSEQRRRRDFGVRDLTQVGTVDRLTINRAVETLAPGCRRIFLLHDVQGFDHGEIASMLQCTRGNTKSQLHKARKVLRGALAAQAGPATARSAGSMSHPFQPQTTMQREWQQN